MIVIVFCQTYKNTLTVKKKIGVCSFSYHFPIANLEIFEDPLVFLVFGKAKFDRHGGQRFLEVSKCFFGHIPGEHEFSQVATDVPGQLSQINWVNISVCHVKICKFCAGRQYGEFVLLNGFAIFY